MQYVILIKITFRIIRAYLKTKTMQKSSIFFSLLVLHTACITSMSITAKNHKKTVQFADPIKVDAATEFDIDQSSIDDYLNDRRLEKPEETLSRYVPTQKKVYNSSKENRWVKALPHQEDIIHAINAGDVATFEKQVQQGYDFTSPNHRGYTPWFYLTCWITRSCDHYKQEHRTMFKMLHQHLPIDYMDVSVHTQYQKCMYELREQPAVW